jgi:hypothetical protein
LSIEHADTGAYPASQYSGPYAVTIANVGLEDATGHALSLYGTAPNVYGVPAKHVNDIYVHHSAINSSGVTGVLGGVNFESFDDRFCDNTAGFANSPSIYSPRNLRLEYNTFDSNNTGAMGINGARW